MNQYGPDLISKEEEKQIAEMIETNIDFATEQKHIHEIVQDDEGEGM